MDEAERELAAWHVLLDDNDYRLEYPEDYRPTLYQRAEELRLRGLIDCMERFELKEWANAAYTYTLKEISV